MFKWNSLFLTLLLSYACCSSTPVHADDLDDAVPAQASGTFVQRKTLADVEVTITSRGTFRFVKGKSFEWNTKEPLPSVFVATPTNYAITVNGKTTAHRLKNDVTSIAKIFEIKEVKEFVKGVKTIPERGFPEKIVVEFKNGDKLEIELTR